MSLDRARGPDGLRIYAIGDVHGRLDCLDQMYAQIDDDLAKARPRDHRIIHLGDYVDRGPESCGVLDFLIERMDADSRVMALAGNHDIEFLAFLRDPEEAQLFIDCGGEATARSYGVELDFSSRKATRKGHVALVEAVPERHVAFLESLAFSVEAGDFFFCHAGIRPGVPLARQDPDDLAWIRHEFLNFSGLHPKVVVHGHTPAPQVEVRPNRINVDTRAFETGRLSAVAIDRDERWFLEARA
jgi:serine/threonine protein phosphatase 1